MFAVHRMLRCLALVCLLQLPHALSEDPKRTVKLVEYIQKKQYDRFVKELSTEGMDVNQPTPNGKLPLTEAVKIKDIKFVDPLLQFMAVVNVKEPSTGASPIMLAFQANLVDVSKLLLAYGADPHVAANNGKKASDVMASSAIKELYAAWEKRGAMAFEDEPGSWTKSTSGADAVEYWFHKDASEGRWNLPPSCAWQRVEQLDGPAKYVNYVTGQTVYTRPAPLSWVKVHTEGHDFWYNWAANITQVETPDEMPAYMIEEAERNVNVRWFNAKTEKFSWEDPKANNHWRPITEGDGASEQQPYYYNIATGESQWEVPDELAWTKHEHDSGPFYFNKKTSQSTWDVPENEAWIRQDHDL